MKTVIIFGVGFVAGGVVTYLYSKYVIGFAQKIEAGAAAFKATSIAKKAVASSTKKG